VQRADIVPEQLEQFISHRPEAAWDNETIAKVYELLKASSRPIILAGGGVRISDATDEMYELAHKTGAPVVASLMGIDAFPHDDMLYSGMIGTYGNRYANLALANADLIIALGTRLDTRQTGTRPETFAREARLVHIDIDASELNNKVIADVSIKSDIKQFLKAFNNKLENINKGKSSWLNAINGYKTRYPSYIESADGSILPNYFLHTLSSYLPENAIICADIGQNQIWSAQSLRIKRGQRFLTEGGMAAMGSALPMAIGASFACPGRTVVIITGDGGFQLNIQELQTIRHHRLPIKIIMLNNKCYGMVRQFQEQYFNGRCQSTVIGYSCPDFQRVVAAYDIPVARIEQCKDIDASLSHMLSVDGRQNGPHRSAGGPWL
jgi:acetolactate synthase-1/2/3 large subunit